MTFSKCHENGPVSMASEVVDMIIDNLHDCKHALRSCAVVSRAWLPASRFHLFRSIALHPNYENCPRYSVEKRYPHRSCNGLYALIQRSPHIVALIHELHILEGNWEKGHDWLNETPCLALLLDSLTHLNALHLRRIDWIQLTPELRGAFRRVLASNPVSNFNFERCEFPFSSLLSILNTCSTSMSLSLLSFGIATSDFSTEKFETVEKEEVGHRELGSKYRFHELRIIECPSEISSLFNDPESGPDLSQLHTLHCNFRRTLLLQLEEHLQHLCLQVPRHQPFGQEDHLPLKHLTGLRSLQLIGLGIWDLASSEYSGSGPSWLKETFDYPGSTWLKRQLHSIRGATHLQCIKLKIYVQEDPTNYCNAWAAVDSIFDGDTFPELRKFEVYPSTLKLGEHTYSAPWRDLHDKVESLFPRLQGRKVLDVC